MTSPSSAANGNNTGAGAAVSADGLVQALYAELRNVASRERWRLGNSPTLQTTALINETWLKLHKVESWSNRQHFLCAAAVAMRQVLIDAARERYTAKRGGGVAALTLSAAERVAEDSDESLLQLEAALSRLQALDPRLAKVVECRFFAGFNELETAEALAMSERTVRRDWLKAKAWLAVELQAD